ncbi:hypothetical protein pb186bvf_008378 [Paramecium bursaria]
MYNNLLDQFREQYKSNELIYEDFDHILEQFGKLDSRCQLEDQVKRSLYDMLKEKQQVNYATIEILVFQYLIQQPIEEIQIDPNTIGKYAKKVPQDMLVELSNEFLQQFTNFYKLCVNKFQQIAEYKDIQKLAQDLKRTIKLDPTDILRYIQVLVNEQDKVFLNDILNLINDLERIIIQTQRKQVKQKNNSQKPQEVLDLSSDEEKLHQKRVDYSNIVYQNVDLLRQQKFFQKHKEGNNFLQEIVKAVQQLDHHIKLVNKHSDEVESKFEEIFLEKELMQSQLEQFETQNKTLEQQVQALLEDNDYLQLQFQAKLDEKDILQQKYNKSIEDQQSISAILTENKLKQNEIDRLEQQIQKQKKEIERLNENSKELMKIIETLELNQQIEENAENVEKPQPQQIIVNEELTQELKQIIENLQLDVFDYKQKITRLEQENLDLRIQSNHYKDLYGSSQQELVNMRTSVMPGSNLRFSTNPQSNLRFSTNPNRLTNNQLRIPPKPSYMPLGILSSNRQSTQRQSVSPLISTKIPRISFTPQLPIEEQDEQTLIDQQDRKQTLTFGGDTLIENFKSFFNLMKANQSDEIQQPEINDDILYVRDYLNIRGEPKVSEKIRAERELHDNLFQRCLSDSVYRIDAKGNKARRIIFLTEYNFYIFEGEKKPTKLSRQYPIDHIKSLIFSETSPILCCIKIKDSDDYLIETFKRSELNTYLTEVFVARKLQLFQLDFRTSFAIKFKGLKDPKKIEDVQKQGYLDGGKMSPFKVSQLQGNQSTKVGWLQMHKKGIFKDWQEVFVLLTNVGLIIFKKPGDMEPILFVSIVEAMVIKNPLTEHNKQFIFKIRYQVSEMDFLFATTSQQSLDEWHDMIQQAVMEQLRIQKKFLDSQQTEITKQRTKTLQDQFDQK